MLTRFTSCAAAVNLFVLYLGQFIPEVAQPVPRMIVITVLVGTLAVVNYRGVGGGTFVSNISVVAKLLPLGLICAMGVGYLIAHPPTVITPVPASADGWFKAMLLLFFAYGGYEAILIAMGEAKDPRRDAPFALFVGLFVVAVIYTVLQFTVVGVLPDPAHSERPLADVAGTLMGRAGATVVAVAALTSVYGFLSAHLLVGSRAMFSLAELGDFPTRFAAIHARFRTPHVSISMFALLIWAFAAFGGF
jgi:amino acid transporter